MSVFSKADRVSARLEYNPGDVIVSNATYNMIIGLVLIYGFIVNVIMINYFYEPIFNLASNPIIFFVVYFAMIVCGSLLVTMSSNPAISFLGYNLIVVPMGFIITVIVEMYVMSGYRGVITTAFAMTAVITAIMIILSSIFDDFFISIGKALVYTLFIVIVVSIAFYFLGFDTAIIDYICVLLFAGFIGYDWAKANRCVKTVDNAVDSAAELYIDIANLFLRLVRILGRSNR